MKARILALLLALVMVASLFPPNDELKEAMDVFCICAKLAACAKILNK